MRNPYSLKEVIRSCAFYANFDPELQICKDCPRYWICHNRPDPKEIKQGLDLF